MANRRNILGITVSPEENFGDWYSQILIKSELIEYYDVSGCYILRPKSYYIWEQIQKWLQSRISDMGTENVYFPLFIPGQQLEKEKTHLEDFSPEVAWINTKEKISHSVAIRPTSETAIYPYFAKWIQSHRQLPLHP